MFVRHYQPGDEQAQARIYNTAAGSLPGFKPATADEIERRYRAADPDPASKFYAVADGQVVGYAVVNPSGRISFPWCLPDAQDAREPLLEAVLAALGRRRCPAAWAVYRPDWGPVLRFFGRHGFARAWEMVNYVADLAGLPHTPVPPGQAIVPLARADAARVLALGRGVFPGDDPGSLEKFFWENPLIDPASLYALRQGPDGQTLGVGLAIINPRYADPARLDPAMPCFRLGALGTESERHKRVNGMFSCLFTSESAGTTLLAEAVRRMEQAGLAHMAAQAASDQPELNTFYGRHFHRQGGFPVLVRRLTATRGGQPPVRSDETGR